MVLCQTEPSLINDDYISDYRIIDPPLYMKTQLTSISPDDCSHKTLNYEFLPCLLHFL